jgi:hypothetical protein
MALTATALGSAASAGAVTSQSTGALVASAPVGALVVVGVSSSASGSVFSLSDTKSNTWTGSTSILSTSFGKSTVFWSVLTTALVSGVDSISLGVTTSAQYTIRATRYDTPAGTSASVKDVETSGSNTTGTAMSSGATASTTNANDVVVGEFFSPSPGTTFTVGSGYTLTPGTSPATAFTINWSEYKEVVATGAQTAAATQSVSSGWHAYAIALRLAVSVRRRASIVPLMRAATR